MTGNGQSAANPQYLKTIIPPAPNAANLGVYADYPVEGFSGIPGITIKIHEIKLNGFTLPIDLSYNASGVKVSTVASWVGLGWSLNAGGLITRSVNRFPDDIWRSWTKSKKYGYLLDGAGAANNFTDVNKTSLQIANQLSEISGSAYHYDDNLNPELECKEGYSAYAFDTEPDVFYYNFSGTTGKFIMALDKSMKFIPFRNFHSTYQLDESPYPDWAWNSYGIRSFKMTDDYGNQYLFSNVDSSATSSANGSFFALCGDRGTPFEPKLDYRFFSSWYLTKITTANGEEINFSYVLEKIKSVNRTMRGRDYYDFIEGKVAVDDYETTTYSNRLVSIETSNEKVIFSAEMSRDDLYNSKALTGISIYSKRNAQLELKRKFTFNYTYFQSPQQQVSIPGVWSPRDGGGDIFKRLKLNSITESSGVLQKAPYEFSYNEDVQIPHRYSYEQDFWGYFNDNNDVHPFPMLYVYPSMTGAKRLSIFQRYSYPGVQLSLFGANRKTNPNTIAAWTINKIKYPTAGYTSFEFESHDFFYNEQNRIGGGLRLKRKVTGDCEGCTGQIVKNYSYRQSADLGKSSGVILNIPSFGNTENACGYFARSAGQDVWPNTFAANSYNYFKYFTVKTDYSKSTLGSDEGINVGYTEIREETEDNGYTIRTFAVPAKSDDLNDTPGGGYCDAATDGYCDNLFEVPAIKYVTGYHLLDAGGWGCFNGQTNYSTPQTFTSGPDLNGLDFSKTAYPFPPNINYEWNRGLLLGSKVFDKNGYPVKEEKFRYRIYYPGSGIAYIPGLLFTNSSNYNIKAGASIYPDELWVYSKYRLIANITKLLEETTERIFDQNDHTKFIELKTNYFYENSSFANNTRMDTYDSKGSLVSVRKKYPFQKNEIKSITSLTASAEVALDTMASRNIIALPILEETYKNGNFVSSSLVNYRVWPTPTVLVAPEEIYLKKGSNERELAAQFHTYDSHGNILEQSRSGDMHHSYIWGYNKTYPIADVTNASPNEIFHESFEENAGTLDANAKTGKRSYNGDYFLNFPLPSTAQPYLLTYWYWDGIQWQYLEKNYSGPILLTEGTKIDEVRVYPSKANMTTYTYDPLVGITSQCSVNNIVIYYEYDALGRLKSIRNQHKEILKQLDYQYRVTGY